MLAKTIKVNLQQKNRGYAVEKCFILEPTTDDKGNKLDEKH